MLFDKNGMYFTNGNNDYDFAVDIINGQFDQDNSNNMNNMLYSKIYDPTEALKKGNAFPNLYEPYKNYNPMDLKVSNAREKMLLEIQKLDFIINDLNLYLDLNPDDTYMYNMLKEYINECKKRKDAYTKMYGPLCIDDLNDDEYEWSKGVWPWEEGMM